MTAPRILVAGGGAAGIFGAITAAGAGAAVTVFEKGPEFLQKVRISGGGRCNVTHACFEPKEFATRYPRGGRELIGPMHRFGAAETVAWFESRGVALKAEADGRMFPVTDDSRTIVECLARAAREGGVVMKSNEGVESVTRRPAGGFEVVTTAGARLECDRLLLASGGCRVPALARVPVSLGHTIEEPVPSLFTFHIECPWLRALAGVSVARARVSVPGTRLSECGPLLVTHWGLSGPAVLRLSAWGARALHRLQYGFPLEVDWLPEPGADAVEAALRSRRMTDGAKRVVNLPIAPVPGRLWEALVIAAGLRHDARWAALTRAEEQRLTAQLRRTQLKVSGKSLNKDEFVTCGGVRLAEVDFKRMESRLCPGLHFAGEVLDIDGLTGGFNFQAAWTTGWIAGKAMAGA